MTDFAQVYEILRSTDARGYNKITPTASWEEDLTTETKRLGLDRIVAEARNMRAYVEDRISRGDERHDKHHRPHQRFIRWLARCEKGDNYHGRRNEESLTQRLIREAAE